MCRFRRLECSPVPEVLPRFSGQTPPSGLSRRLSSSQGALPTFTAGEHHDQALPGIKGARRKGEKDGESLAGGKRSPNEVVLACSGLSFPL